MKRLVTLVMLGVGAVTTPAAAQVRDECPDPTAGLVAVSGTIDIQPAATCTAADYTVGPVTVLDASPTQVVEDEPEVPEKGPAAARATAAPLQVPQEQVAPVDDPAIDYNMRQMIRLGQLDAMQGRPVNMKYANNLGYMQGYMRGQEQRLRAPGGVGGFGGVQGGGFGGFGR